MSHIVNYLQRTQIFLDSFSIEVHQRAECRFQKAALDVSTYCGWATRSVLGLGTKKSEADA